MNIKTLVDRTGVFKKGNIYPVLEKHKDYYVIQVYGKRACIDFNECKKISDLSDWIKDPKILAVFKRMASK